MNTYSKFNLACLIIILVVSVATLVVVVKTSRDTMAPVPVTTN